MCPAEGGGGGESLIFVGSHGRRFGSVIRGTASARTLSVFETVVA